MKKLIALAVLIRLLVMPFLFHPDIKTYSFQASFLKKGVINIYPYLINNREKLPLKEEFVYFPLTYLFLGSYQTIVSPFLGVGFDRWLFDASQEFSNNPNIFRYLFILKLPYLVLDIATGFALLNFFKDKRLGRRAMLLWLFNPFTIAIIYFYSNVDIIPVFLSTLSLLLLKKEKYLWSSIILGLAAGFKVYPLLFLPFIILDIKQIKFVSLYLLVSIVTFCLTILPFWGQAFISSALVSGLTTRILIPQIQIGFGENLIVPVVLMSLVLFLAFINRGKISTWRFLFTFFLILFSWIHFHIQWLLWVAPFAVLAVTIDESLTLPIIAISSLAVMIPLFYDDKSMTVSLFRIYSNLYNLVPSPFSIIQKFYDPLVLQSILHSLFAGGAVIVSYKNLLKPKK